MANYEYIFTNFDNDTYRVRIEDSTISEDVYTTVYPDGSGGNLLWEGETENTYKPILTSSFSCALFRDVNTRQLLSDLASSTMGRFEVNIWKLTGVNTYSLYWFGFVLQDSMVNPDASDNTDYITFQATDGFGELQGIEWPDYTTELTAKTFIQWLVIIFGKMPLTYLIGSAACFKNASVWYEDSMNSSVIPTPEKADPLYTTYIHPSAFVEMDEYGVVKGMTYYDILMYLLNAYNLEVRLWKGTYLLIQQNTFAQASTRAWYYTKSGTYLSTELIDLQQAYTMPVRATGGMFRYLAPIRKITTEYDYKVGIYKGNLFPPIVERDTTYDLGNSIIDAAFSFGGVIQTDFEGDGDLDRIRVFYKLLIRNGTHYLDGTTDDLVWTTNSNSYVPVYTRGFKSNSTVTLFTEFNFDTILPEDGAAITFEWQFSDLVLNSDLSSWTPPDGSSQTMTHASVLNSFYANINTGIAQDGTILYEANVSEDIKYTLELPKSVIGDGPTPIHAGAIRILNTSDAVVISDKWNIYSEIGITAKQMPLHNLRCREMLALRRDTTLGYDGMLYETPDIQKGFSWDNQLWVMNRLSWNMSNNEASFSAWALLESELNTPFLKIAANNNILSCFIELTRDPGGITVDWGDGSTPEIITYTDGGFTLYHLFNVTKNCNVYLTGDLSSARSLEFSLTSNPVTYIDFTILTSVIGLGLSDTLITTIDLTGFTKIGYLTLSNTPISSIDLTGLFTLVNLNLANSSLTSDSILQQLDILFEYLVIVDLTNTTVPTPSILLAAQTANPQCTFYVDSAFITVQATDNYEFSGSINYPSDPLFPLTVNWGDGSEPETINIIYNKGKYYFPLNHTYAIIGTCGINVSEDLSVANQLKLEGTQTTSVDLTRVNALSYLNLSNTQLKSDSILEQLNILFPNLNNCYITDTTIPTPSILLAAQTANPQCTFSVDS